MLVIEGGAQLETGTNLGTLHVGSSLKNRACVVQSSEILTTGRQAQFIHPVAFLFRQVFSYRLRLVFPCKRCLRGIVVGEGKHVLYK